MAGPHSQQLNALLLHGGQGELVQRADRCDDVGDGGGQAQLQASHLARGGGQGGVGVVGDCCSWMHKGQWQPPLNCACMNRSTEEPDARIAVGCAVIWAVA